MRFENTFKLVFFLNQKSWVSLRIVMFTDLVDYHVHPGTLHAKSIVGPGRLSTMYRGHYINLSQDCEYNLYMNMKKIIIIFWINDFLSPIALKYYCLKLLCTQDTKDLSLLCRKVDKRKVKKNKLQLLVHYITF